MAKAQCVPVFSIVVPVWLHPQVDHAREVNGLLVDAAEPTTLAAAILRGLNEPALRERAAKENAAIIAVRAEYTHNMLRAAAFYARLVG